MRVTPVEFKAIKAKAAMKKAKRQEKAAVLWPQKPQKIASPSGSVLEERLWKVFSAYIRLRDKTAVGGCFYCVTGPIECAMHRIKRGRRAVKYDERNVHGGCHRCNFMDGPGNQSQMFDAIFIRKLGATLFLELEEKGREIAQMSKTDIIQLTEKYRQKIEELNRGK